MKKLILLSSLSLCTFSAFAYYSSPELEFPGWITFLLWTAAILNIILFFKIWAMTNNVTEIKSILKNLPNNFSVEDLNLVNLKNKVRMLYYTGKINEAYELLNSYLFNKIAQISNAERTKENKIIVRAYSLKEGNYKNFEIQEYIDEKIESVEHIYRLIDKEIPEKLKTITYEQFIEFNK